MNRKETKRSKVLHQKQLKSIEMVKRIKIMDSSNDLFTIVYNKQNKSLSTSYRLVHSFYDFIKLD